jgi:hypothetical protein
MEEIQGPARQNRTTVILLGVIALLLIVVAAILLTQGGDKTPGSPTGNAGGGNTSSNTTGTTMPGTGTTPQPFDPATATKVPAGETPDEYVKKYFEAVLAGDYAAAYERLPADKKAAQDQASFAEQLKGYGISAYTIDDVSEKGDEAQVYATATMAGGSFQYLWTFVKGGDGWLVKSRTLPGMGQ